MNWLQLENENKYIFIRLLLRQQWTYDTMEYHTIAIERFRSLCNTMDSALRRPHFGNNSQHSALAGTHSVVECANAVSVNPISGMGFLS